MHRRVILRFLFEIKESIAILIIQCIIIQALTIHCIIKHFRLTKWVEINMARRYEHTHEELLNLAINAGHKLIEKQSLSGLSLRKAAQIMGYSVGTLQQLFGSYTNYILHINAIVLDDLYQTIQEKQSQTDSNNSLDKVRAVCYCYLEYSQQKHHLWRAIYDFSSPDGFELPDWYQAKIDALLVTLTQTLTPIFQQQAQEHAQVIWASIHGICYLGSHQKLDLVHAQNTQSLVDRFLNQYFLGIYNE